MEYGNNVGLPSDTRRDDIPGDSGKKSNDGKRDVASCSAAPLEFPDAKKQSSIDGRKMSSYCKVSIEEGAKSVTCLDNFLSPANYAGNKGNCICSPLSCAFLLSLLEVGSKSETRPAIRDLFGNKNSDLNLLGSVAALMKLIGESGIVKMGNVILISTAAKKVSSKYIDFVIASLAEMSELPQFQYRIMTVNSDEMITEGFQKYVNELVGRWTENKIQKILPRSLEPWQKVVFLNTVHFKARWPEPLDVKPEFEFCDAAGKVCNVPAIEYIKASPFASVNDLNMSWEVSWCEFENKEYGLLLAMPPKGKHAEAFGGSSIFPKAIGAINSCNTRKTATFPMLKVESELDFVQITGISKKVNLALGPFSDFSGIASGLSMSDIKHKAVFVVDQFGAEAAAVTETVFLDYDYDEVSFNRPFKVYIVHKPSETILFEGNITEQPEISLEKTCSPQDEVAMEY